MKTIEFAVLATITVVILFRYWPTPDSIHEPSLSDDSRPVAKIMSSNQQVQKSRSVFEQNQTSMHQPDVQDSIANQLPQNSVDAASIVEPLDWPLLLYPELGRIYSLENQPAEVALEELLEMVSSDSPVVRLAVIVSLGDMTTASVIPALIAALEDPEPRLRIAALEALSAHDHASVTSSIEPYLFDADPEVRLAAIEALANLEASSAVHSLISLLYDENSAIRQSAVNALGDIDAENVAIYLQQARYDTNAAIASSASSIIGELEHHHRD